MHLSKDACRPRLRAAATSPSCALAGRYPESRALWRQALRQGSIWPLLQLTRDPDGDSAPLIENLLLGGGWLALLLAWFGVVSAALPSALSEEAPLVEWLLAVGLLASGALSLCSAFSRQIGCLWALRLVERQPALPPSPAARGLLHAWLWGALGVAWAGSLLPASATRALLALSPDVVSALLPLPARLAGPWVAVFAAMALCGAWLRLLQWRTKVLLVRRLRDLSAVLDAPAAPPVSRPLRGSRQLRLVPSAPAGEP